MLAVLLLSGCFLLGESEDNPLSLRPCGAAFECGPLYNCIQVPPDVPGSKTFCIEQGKEGAILAAYYNAKYRVCIKSGHAPAGSERTNCLPSGIPNCERCWKTQQCSRCRSDVPTSESWFRGSGCPDNLPRECVPR